MTPLGDLMTMDGMDCTVRCGERDRSPLRLIPYTAMSNHHSPFLQQPLWQTTKKQPIQMMIRYNIVKQMLKLYWSSKSHTYVCITLEIIPDALLIISNVKKFGIHLGRFCLVRSEAIPERGHNSGVLRGQNSFYSIERRPWQKKQGWLEGA